MTMMAMMMMIDVLENFTYFKFKHKNVQCSQIHTQPNNQIHILMSDQEEILLTFLLYRTHSPRINYVILTI